MGLFWGEKPKSAGLWLRLEEEGVAAPAAAAAAAGSRRQMSVRREAGGAGWGSKSKAEPSLRPKPGGGYTMPPAGSGESDVLSYCTFFFALCTTAAFLVCFLVACSFALACADADAGQTCCSARGGLGGSCGLLVCVCAAGRGLRRQYIRETFSLSCFRRHVPFLGFSGVRWKMPGHALAGGHRDQMHARMPPVAPRASIVAVKLSTSVCLLELHACVAEAQ